MDVGTGRTIWIEVDDLIRYFDGSVTPTGIGRVQAEILPHLARAWPGRVRFCRVGETSRHVEILDYATIARLIDVNAFLASNSTDSLLFPMLRFRRYLGRRLTAARRAAEREDAYRDFAATVKPGDVLLNLGASWSHKHFGRTVAELKRDHGIGFGILVHDVLPASHPHLVSPTHKPTFDRWLAEMAQVWDFALTPSRSSAAALAAHLAAHGTEPPPIRPIPFGAGFPATPPPVEESRTHVLYVSTIEIRKNHMLLFKVWERLLRELGSDAVPQLVFAGKYGWEIDDLKQSLRATAFLGGKIRVVENLSDAELANFYARSHFTVFPSLCEGWGLPVAESLYFGRYCVASNATSIPEVGGAFVDYHDPTDVDAAYRLIKNALFEPGLLARKEADIREGYRPRSWEGTADAIVAAVDDLAPRQSPMNVVFQSPALAFGQEAAAR